MESNRPTSDLPPAPNSVDEALKITPEMRAWLDKGWSAKCACCRHQWQSHEKVSDTRCPRCGALPDIRASFEAIDSMPGPATLPESWQRKASK